MKIAGVILAGGQATRMGGGHKGLLRLGGRRVIEHVIDRLSPQVDDIVINANGDPTVWSDFPYRVIADSMAEYPGPLAGILAGMDWAASQGATHVVSVAADTPFFPANLVQLLTKAAIDADQPISLAATKEGEKTWRHPTFGLWPVALADDLRQAIDNGMRKVVIWTDAKGCTKAVFPSVPLDPFFNINTPKDLALAEEMV